MKAHEAIAKIESEVKKGDIPDFCVGDTVKVHLKVKEGDKTRTQVFEGTCISRRGRGVAASFAVVKETHGNLVEKVFPIYSPMVERIQVVGKIKVRRAKLYHLRKQK